METQATVVREEVHRMLSQLGFEEPLIGEILIRGRSKKVSAGQVIISPGSRPHEIPMVVRGTLKILRQDQDGNEILLYYLQGGETCAMSITCCLESKKSEISAVAEEEGVIWLIPVNALDEWIRNYLSFRKFIFASYQSRFDEMLSAIDSMVFMRMDERLYKYLLDKKQSSGSYTIHKTHQEIARELNTSRVVVSRLLKKLENEGRIEQHRNKIEVL